MDNHQIDSLKSKLDPFSVVAQYSHQELKPGRNLRCPNQKHAQTGNTPPASMDYKTGLWTCFGCGAKGDLIDWIGFSLFTDWNCEHRGHNFITLLDMLSGLQIVPISIKEKEARVRSYQSIIKQTFDQDRALEWNKNLLAYDGLLEWLARRGVKYHMALKYKLGYIPFGEKHVERWEVDKLVIPHIYRGVIVGIKLRVNPLHPTENKMRYLAMKGSSFHVPYNADLLHVSLEKAYSIETELDSLAVMDYKKEPCIAAPMKMIDAIIQAMLFVRKPFYIMQNDNAGLIAAQKFKAGLARGRVISTPDLVKDAGEYYQQFGAMWEF